MKSFITLTLPAAIIAAVAVTQAAPIPAEAAFAHDQTASITTRGIIEELGKLTSCIGKMCAKGLEDQPATSRAPLSVVEMLRQGNTHKPDHHWRGETWKGTAPDEAKLQLTEGRTGRAEHDSSSDTDDAYDSDARWLSHTGEGNLPGISRHDLEKALNTYTASRHYRAGLDVNKEHSLVPGLIAHQREPELARVVEAQTGQQTLVDLVNLHDDPRYKPIIKSLNAHRDAQLAGKADPKAEAQKAFTKAGGKRTFEAQGSHTSQAPAHLLLEAPIKSHITEIKEIHD